MSEWDVLEHDGSQGITLDQRHRTRLVAANWVRKAIPQRWDDSVEELTEILDMLGLLPSQDEISAYRTKLRDCGPVMRQGNRR